MLTYLARVLVEEKISIMESTALLPIRSTTTHTKANYNRLACCYDSWSSWEQPYIDAAFDLLELRPTHRVLDIGCATGQFLARAGQIVGHDGTVVGFDLSPNMCEKARKHCRDVPATVVIQCGDAAELLESCTTMFDCIVMTFTLELFNDHDAKMMLTLAALRLTPEHGRMVVVSMSTAVEKAGCMMCLYNCFRCCCPCVVDCRPIDLQSIVENVPELAVVSRRVLPMYGLAVEIVELKRSSLNPS